MEAEEEIDKEKKKVDETLAIDIQQLVEENSASLEEHPHQKYL